MFNAIPRVKYEELGQLLKEYYWEYVESKQIAKNDFILTIENAFSYLDDGINPYNNGNYNVSFSYNNSEYGAKKFLKELENSDGFAKVISIINKASEHTSNFRALSLLMLPYMFEKLNVTNSEVSYGIRLAILITFLVMERSISVKKNKVQKEEIAQLKSSLIELKKNFDDLTDFNHAFDVIDSIDNDK